MFDNQRALGLEWMNRLVALARRPPFERSTPLQAWQAEVDRVRKTWFAPYFAALPVLMTPAATASERALNRYQAGLGAAVILCAAGAAASEDRGLAGVGRGDRSRLAR